MRHEVYENQGRCTTICEDNIKEAVLAGDWFQWRIVVPWSARAPLLNNKQPIPPPPPTKWEVPPGGILSVAFSHIARPMWGRWLHCYPPSRGGVTIATNYFTRR
jgi:hypothetical protein